MIVMKFIYFSLCYLLIVLLFVCADILYTKIGLNKSVLGLGFLLINIELINLMINIYLIKKKRTEN